MRVVLVDGPRICRVCGEKKPLEAFEHDATAPFGRTRRCKACANARFKRMRETPQGRAQLREYGREHRARRPDQIAASRHAYETRHAQEMRAYLAERQRSPKGRARVLLNRAVAAGQIVRPASCEDCGRSGRVQGHHEDYSRPLAVRWLCRGCHVEADIRLAERIRLERSA